MPMLSLKCSREVPEELLKELSSAVADGIGKPEKYVMVVAEKVDLAMSGMPGDAACGEVRSIGGLNQAVNRKLTMNICTLLSDRLGIPADRIYITFQSVPADHWGWNGSTFG